MKKWLLEHRKSLIIAVVVVIGLPIIFWQFIAQKATVMVRDKIAQSASERINGQIKVGSIQLPLPGWTHISDLVVYDERGNMILQSKALDIEYNWADLMNGTIGLHSVKAITIENAKFIVDKQKEKWNWQELFKPSAKDDDKGFRGIIYLKNIKAAVQSDELKETIDVAEGKIDYLSYPHATVQLKGKIRETALQATGMWKNKEFDNFSVQVDKLNLKQFQDKIVFDKNTKLEKGVLENFVVRVKRDKKGELIGEADGEIVDINLTGELDLAVPKGKFTANSQGIKFSEMQLLVRKQAATGQGEIFWRKDKSTVQLSLSLPDVDPTVLSEGLAVKRPVAVKMEITGEIDNPQTKGSFYLPSINVSDMDVQDVSGKFRYTDGGTQINNVVGRAYNGKLYIDGTISKAGQNFELDVSGEGMDSSRLTDKDVSGPLDFTGRSSGQGEQTVTNGSFVIHNGKAYGVAFVKMTGNFVKKGKSTDISDIEMQTSLGTFYPEHLTQNVMEQIKNQRIPVTKKELENVVTKKILQKFLR